MGNLRVKVQSLQLNAEGLLKLLGGNEADRERFLEIIKGITTPAVFRVLENQLETLDQQVKAATHTLKTIQANAKELSGQAQAQKA